jgi:hypothetical protein
MCCKEEQVIEITLTWQDKNENLFSVSMNPQSPKLPCLRVPWPQESRGTGHTADCGKWRRISCRSRLTDRQKTASCPTRFFFIPLVTGGEGARYPEVFTQQKDVPSRVALHRPDFFYHQNQTNPLFFQHAGRLLIGFVKYIRCRLHGERHQKT